MVTFKDLELSSALQKALDELGYSEPTEIQKKAIPLLLSADKIDFHGQAQTGTGKTLAFGIPLLQRIDQTNKHPQALVVAPTRELAIQIYESLQKAAKYLNVSMTVIYGGASMEDQIRTLKRGVQIVIGTPGRLNDHLRRKTLAIDHIRTLVLDEADIMLDMGFKEEIDEILTFAPENREIWLFSATVKPGISAIMKSHMTEPVSVRVSAKQVGTSKTKQYFCIVPFRSRLHAVTRFIQATPDFYGFIFCQTKILASELAEQLTRRGYNVGALHGDLSQAQRNMVIKKFKQQDFSILVATDVAARGIDIANLTYVINYSIPDDLESYVHRIGRTGRAGKEGTAITFISRSEQRQIEQIERKFMVEIKPIDVPSKDTLIITRLAEARTYVENLKDNKDVDTLFKDMLKDMPIERLKAVTSQLFYDKFMSTLDLEEIPYTHVEAATEQLQELFISAGIEDNITRDDVEKFIMQTGLVKPDQIRTIRIIKQRTFVKLSADCSPELVNALKGKLLNGLAVRVNITCVVNYPEQQQDRRSSGGRGGDRRGGGRGGYEGRGRQGGGYRGGPKKRY